MSKSVSIVVAVVCLIALYSDVTLAGDSGSTFESFYVSPANVSWLLAGVVALCIGILVFVGWPVLGAPTIASIGSIGSAVGGLFGLSGIAATNFGLALLGGGSVVSGGFGIVGGTAVLAAALSFGTDVTLDYALGKATSAYSAERFSRDSLSMMTLPLPLNTGGPESVQAAGEALEGHIVADAVACARQLPTSADDFRTCISALQRTQRQRVHDALDAMDGFTATSNITLGSIERKHAMLALLKFLNNDYLEARREAEAAYKHGIEVSNKPTLPAFISATSMLYEDRPNFAESRQRLKYSILEERDNPLTPVLFSTYLDRLSYRLNDGTASVADMYRLEGISAQLPYAERRLAMHQTLLTFYVMQVYVNQQRILSLISWEGRTAAQQLSDRAVVRASLRDHEQLLKFATSLARRQQQSLAGLNGDATWHERLREMKNPFGDAPTERQQLMKDWAIAIQRYQEALKKYQGGLPILKSAVVAYDEKVIKAQGR